MAREDPEFIWGQNMRLASPPAYLGEGRRASTKPAALPRGLDWGRPPPGTSGARAVPRRVTLQGCPLPVPFPMAERSYLPAWLSLGTRHSSGSFVPGVAPEPRGTHQPPGTRCTLQCTETGHWLHPSPTPSGAGCEQPSLEGLRLHRMNVGSHCLLCKSNWSLFRIPPSPSKGNRLS